MQKEYKFDELPDVKDAKVVIVASKWYSEYIQNMVDKCLEVFSHTKAKTPEVHILPGTFELPLGAKTLLDNNDDIEAVIAFGIVMKGETMHFEMIVDETTRSFGEIIRKYSVPIIMEVLPVTKEEQLVARCSKDNYNKGIEAALAAIEMIAWKRKVKKETSSSSSFGF